MLNITDISFKDEGEIQGEPVGPMTVLLEDSTQFRYGWRRLSEAEEFCRRCGVALNRM